MIKTITLACFAFATGLHAQTVLFFEDFSSTTPAFTLNTTDVSSVASGANTWLVNNVYAGGPGEVICFGLPFGFTVPNTPAQPTGITDPNGHYLHTASQAAISSGVQNCCFIAADGGLCAPAQNHFARMSSDVSTEGMDNVTLSFWWLCGGSTNNYGEVYYSTNGGSSWTAITTPIAQYHGQTNWVQQTISLPAFSGQATLRFGFRFVNNTTFSASDPGFGIDDVRITAEGSTNTVATGTISPLSYCQGASVQVPYTASGTFAPGNVFTAELSDASGAFTAPVAIGSLASASSGTIAATIPVGMAPGTGYRIRVVASDPATEGSVNAGNITVTAAPSAGNDVVLALCNDAAVPNLLDHVDGGALNGDFHYQGVQLLPDLTVPGTYEVEYIVGGGGCPADTATFNITVHEAPNAGTGVSITFCVYDPVVDLFSLLSGSPDPGGTWIAPQGIPHSGILDPAVGPDGLYTYEVAGTPPCEDDQAFVAVVIDACVGMDEVAAPAFRWAGQEGGAHLFIVPRGTPAAVAVMDATGRLLDLTGRVAQQGDRLRVDLSGRPQGMYFVRFGEQAVLRMVHAAR
mgnify:CR=1 FL=1|jgi:hypothetical protein